LKPGLPNADALLAVSLSEQGSFAEAQSSLEKAFRRSTDPAMKRMLGLQLERVYTGTQQDAKAVEVALDMNRLYPKDPEVLYHSERLIGNYAYLTVKNLFDVAPESSWMHQAAGEVYESQDNYVRAITKYQNVLALDPQRPGIHFRIGRVMLERVRHSDARTSETAEAMKEFEQELRIDPSNANAAYELGELHRKNGELEAARGYFEAGLQYYPDFEDAQIALGRTLIALGKPDLALPHLQKAIQLNPESAVTYYALARAYSALGRAKDQQEALTRFQALRDQQASQEAKDWRREVTKQEVDPATEQK
jgi:tetratricopeptide (TPR) repeat protein